MTRLAKKPLPDLDYHVLDRQLDIVKTRVFLGKNAAFLGSIMCSMNFSWTADIKTACTNGINLWWNPRFFLQMPEETRNTILIHELWHPAEMDMIRVGDRDPRIWNYAADIRINNRLHSEGHTFKGFSPWLDHAYDGWMTEDIYDDLYSKKIDVVAKYGQYQWGYVDDEDGEGDTGDLIEPEDLDEAGRLQHTIIANVVMAKTAAELAGDEAPGDTETLLKRFLAPKIAWEKVLYRWFSELYEQSYSWRKRNRRYQDEYLPGLIDDEGALAHLIYYFDVSGSVTDGQEIRFNSEFKYVKDTFRPKKMTLVQFDTKIVDEQEFLETDNFDEITRKGYGGTSLVCVRDHILEHKPTAAVIFSDLECREMEALPEEIPIIWIVLNNPDATVPHGTVIHLRE
ncbi:vWA domain-containing protein [Mesorhizobium sp. CN2-181]|uniref:vWA domain-containing protein n=1 Tax=Mesorhizobium yinganensis TaxID=3157707 RepID=UPI0032B85CF5